MFINDMGTLNAHIIMAMMIMISIIIENMIIITIRLCIMYAIFVYVPRYV